MSLIQWIRFGGHSVRVLALMVVSLACSLLSAADLSSEATAGTSTQQLKPYRERYREQIYRSNIQPRWFADDAGFWYRVQIDRDKSEYVRIDAQTGQKTHFPDLKSLGVEHFEAVRTSEIELSRHERSRSDGKACDIEIVNQTPESLQLAWINGDGQPVHYGEIAQGESFHQHTYEGHLWEVTEFSGDVIARFPAEMLRNKVVIDGPSSGDHLTRLESETRVEGVSPDGCWQAEILDRTVRVTESATGKPFLVEAPKLETGALLRGRISWAPDSMSFVVSATKPVQTRMLQIVATSPTSQLQPQILEVSYPKPGDALPQPVPVLFRLNDTGFESQVIPNTMFANRFQTSDALEYRWAEDSQEFYFDYNQRGHQAYKILAVSAKTGVVRSLVEESSLTFIDYHRLTWRHWKSGGKELLWLSERSGWNHLWKIDVTGEKLPQQLTSGEWIVRDVLLVDEERQAVWFTASGLRVGEDPYHLHLCRIDFDGGNFQQLTTADGNHEIEISPKKNYFVATWSRVDHPPVAELRDLNSGQLVCEIERADSTEFLNRGGVLPKRFVAKGRDGKTDIHGVIFRPTHFDERHKYPVLENVYAGPHAAFSPKKFGTDTKKQDLADLGFIVVQADGMGTNYRGKAFHDVCWKNLKDAGFPDRIAWIKAAAADRSWMDLSRVGIYGGSAGGQTAMRALLDHSDFYHVAVADCGCHDNRMDKIWWNEQWMGWPVDDSYRQSSNVEDAKKLQGQLLLIVGEIDTNVDPASTYQVAHALQKAGKSFELMPIVNVGHGAAETEYGSKLREAFLIKHLIKSASIRLEN